MSHFRDDGDVFLSLQSLTNPQRLWAGKADPVHQQGDTGAAKAVSLVAWPLTSVAHPCRETFAALGRTGTTAASSRHKIRISNVTERLCLGLRVTGGEHSVPEGGDFNQQELLWFESCPAQAAGSVCGGVTVGIPILTPCCSP